MIRRYASARADSSKLKAVASTRCPNWRQSVDASSSAAAMPSSRRKPMPGCEMTPMRSGRGSRDADCAYGPDLAGAA
ncbi:hypothetical protein G6F22_014775 [Rhizopus arrhizus]|nr:hypothetical protein G6F22_014775 [Rhizopus arrhizus]KAG1472753.1 hypothetical protein G6F54_014420 [Rhizopus delemar]